METFRHPVRRISPAALERLRTHPWPGNLALLREVIERAALRTSGDVLELEDLVFGSGKDSEGGEASQLGKTLEDVERAHILATLRQQGGHRGRTARALGIDPKTLYNKLGPERPRRKVNGR